MCGIAGIVHLRGAPVDRLEARLRLMNRLIAHRGPDGEGVWMDPSGSAGLAHRRLSIIDLSENGAQPMAGHGGAVIVHNGAIYNYPELRAELESGWTFRSRTDTETALAAHARYGRDCATHLRGMFAFAIWDSRARALYCARDRFGIKPFYYAQTGDLLYFASEAKALLPFLPQIDTDADALAEYLTFQFCIGDQTLFRGVRQLPPGHYLTAEDGALAIRRYWDVRYEIDHDHSPDYFQRRLRELVADSLKLHLRGDVPVGAHVSGGVDSSLIALLASRAGPFSRQAFHGRFTDYPGYDESNYARMVTDRGGGDLHVADITAADFSAHIRDIIHHLDFPVAGPGSFAQYMVCRLAGRHVKVVLGGQGGDEIFGGYARYLLAYFEQCIRAAVDGTHRNGDFVVTLESILPNLGLLREYKPMMASFWRDGLFGPLDDRYFRLIDRSGDMQNEIDWPSLDRGRVREAFRTLFNNRSNVRKEAYFDSMTHFDFKCLLPALLQVEDRMGMAHGLESRVPLLDHPLVEFAATVPADVKFEGGCMKRLLKTAFADVLPPEIAGRRDKMGFPVPLKEWFAGPLRGVVADIFHNLQERRLSYVNADAVPENFGRAGRFSRKSWGLLSLELWHQLFHDRAAHYRGLLDAESARMAGAGPQT